MQNPWPYYLNLENEFLKIVNVVALNACNKAAFGDKISELLMCVGSEIDTNFKVLFPGDGNIVSWVGHLNSSCPTIALINLTICNSDISVRPFYGINVSGHSGLKWWKSYNSVKHNRYVNFKQANLGNLLNSIAGLYLLNVLIGSKIKTLYPALESKIFLNKEFIIQDQSNFYLRPGLKSDEKNLILNYMNWGFVVPP